MTKMQERTHLKMMDYICVTQIILILVTVGFSVYFYAGHKVQEEKIAWCEEEFLSIRDKKDSYIYRQIIGGSNVSQ